MNTQKIEGMKKRREKKIWKIYTSKKIILEKHPRKVLKQRIYAVV
jgi:hypothetical protein